MAFIDPMDMPSSNGGGGFIDPMDVVEAPQGASSMIPTGGYAQAPQAQATPYEQRRAGPAAPNQLYDPSAFNEKIKGMGEAGLNTLTGLTSGGVGMAGGFLGALAGAAATGHWDPKAIEELTGEAGQKMTYEPKTGAGQHYTEQVGQLMNELVPIMGVAHTLPPVSRRPALPKAGERNTPAAVGNAKIDSLKAQAEGTQGLEPTLEEKRAAAQGKPIERAGKGTIFVDPMDLAWEGNPIRSAPEVEALAKERATQLQRQAQGLVPEGQTIVAGERAPEIRSTPEVEAYAQEQALRKAEALRREQLGLPPLDSVIEARQSIPEVRSAPEVEAYAQQQAMAKQREARGLPPENEPLYAGNTVSRELPGAEVRSSPEVEALMQERARAMQREAQGLAPEGETIYAGKGRGATASERAPIRSTPEVEALARERAAALEREAKGLAPEGAPMFASREGVVANDLAAKVGSRPEDVNAVRDAQQRALEEQAYREAFPKDEQLDAFGEPKTVPLGPFNEFRTPKGQRGHLNMDIFSPDFNEIKDLGNGIRLWFQGGREHPEVGKFYDPKVVALDAAGNEVGRLELSPTAWNREPTGVDNLKADWVDTEGAPGQGLAKKMYEFASEQGDIVPSNVQTDAGRAMWDKFGREGFAQNRHIPRSQRGAFDLNAISEEIKKFIGAEPDPVLRAQIEKQNNIASSIPGLNEFRNRIDTPEKAIAMAPVSRDITGMDLRLGKSVKPGLRKMKFTGNPLLQMASALYDKSRLTAENLSREYLTDKKNGLGQRLQQLSDQELTEVHAALREGDKRQRYWTRNELTNAGFNEKQISFVERMKEAGQKLLEETNAKRAEVGMEPIQERQGWFPGNFNGDYKSLVLDKDGHVMAVIAEDSKSNYNDAVKFMQDKHGKDITITPQTRAKLGGSGMRGDRLSGFTDMLELLAKHDPKFQESLDALKAAEAKHASTMFGTHVHELQKKGILGSEGARPWRDEVTNAKDAMKGYFRLWEESMINAQNLPAETTVKATMQNPAFEGMPNAKSYLTDYTLHANGNYVGDFGHALNTIIDTPGKLMGQGPSRTRGAVNEFTKRMGQKTMGLLNLPFTALQYMQLAQAVPPTMARIGQGLGKSAGRMGMDMSRAARDGMVIGLDRLQKSLGKEVVKVDLDPFQKEMVAEAEKRGLMKFSEFEDVNKLTQGKVGRTVDAVADINRSLPERMTRPYVFFTFARVLEDSNLPRGEIWDTAYNLTQDAMIDYSSREKPMMFKKAGILGQTAGSLQTFAFNYIDNMARWNKELVTKGNVKPWLVGMGTAYTLAGVGGLPGYNELDKLVKFSTNWLGDGMKSIKDIALEHAPTLAPYADQLYYGPASEELGVNVQSRLGTTKTLPEKPSELISPFLGNAADMATTAYDLATKQDKTSAANAAMAWAPSSARGLVENAVRTDEQSNLLDKYGLKTDVQRTPKDKLIRALGLTSQSETKTRDTFYTSDAKRRADDDRKAAISEKLRSGVIQYGQEYLKQPDTQDLVKEYLKRKGTPDSIKSIIMQAEKDRRLTATQRAQGSGQGLSGIYKFEYYNK